MSEHILNQIGEADERLHTQYGDGLQVNRDLFYRPLVSFQANKDNMEIVRTKPATDQHAEI